MSIAICIYFLAAGKPPEVRPSRKPQRPFSRTLPFFNASCSAIPYSAGIFGRLSSVIFLEQKRLDKPVIFIALVARQSARYDRRSGESFLRAKFDRRETIHQFRLRAGG